MHAPVSINRGKIFTLQAYGVSLLVGLLGL